MKAIEAWLDGERINPRGYPRIYHTALIAQNLIGWHSFLRGYWSTYWIQLQDAHLKRTNQYSHKMTGKSWATRMIVHVWDKLHDGWKLHNDKVHGKNTLLKDTDIRRRTIAKIYTLHRMRRTVLHDHDNHLFLTDICTTLRTATLNYLRNWIRLYEPSIRESICTAQSNAIRNTKSLTTYFPPQKSPRKRPPKPRFDQRTRLLRDGRQKTRKRSKPLPNPNAIVSHATSALRHVHINNHAQRSSRCAMRSVQPTLISPITQRPIHTRRPNSLQIPLMRLPPSRHTLQPLQPFLHLPNHVQSILMHHTTLPAIRIGLSLPPNQPLLQSQVPQLLHRLLLNPLEPKSVCPKNIGSTHGAPPSVVASVLTLVVPRIKEISLLIAYYKVLTRNKYVCILKNVIVLPQRSSAM
jgi:hypothetical protein